MIADSVNRVTVLTAAGAAALAVVRISGPAVGSFLSAHFSKSLNLLTPTHGTLRDGNGVIDDPVVVLNANGSAELSLHGSAWIVRCVCDLAVRDGFVLEETPAISIEEDVERALPLIKTEMAMRMLLAQPRAWAEPFDAAEALADHALFHLLQPPTLAIVGPPNAGKSTLANALFGTQRSIVSDIAGTTRDWVGEPADLGGLVVTLLDTPGLRKTTDDIEARAIALSRSPVALADLVLLLLDGTRDDAEQTALLDRYPAALRVLNKSDLRLSTWTNVRLNELNAVTIAAQNGSGLADLIDRIHARFGLHSRPLTAARPFTAAHFEQLRDKLAKEAGRSSR